MNAGGFTHVEGGVFTCQYLVSGSSTVIDKVKMKMEVVELVEEDGREGVLNVDTLSESRNERFQIFNGI